jgi:hypothetical protein
MPSIEEMLAVPQLRVPAGFTTCPDCHRLLRDTDLPDIACPVKPQPTDPEPRPTETPETTEPAPASEA